MRIFVDNHQEFKYCPNCDSIFPFPAIIFSRQVSRNDGLCVYCRECEAERHKVYNEEHKEENKRYREINGEKLRLYNIIYRGEHKEESSEYHRKYRIDNREEISLRRKRFYMEHREEIINRNKKYSQTIKGKETKARTGSRRKRNLDFIPLFENPFPKDIDIDWHHISDSFVVALPRIIHRNCGGGYGTEEHRRLLKPIVEDVFEISYVIF